MKKNKNRISLIILCIIVLLTTVAYGATLKLAEPSNDFYVYDESNIINENVKEYIIDVNKELYEKTGAQIVVASVNSLEDLDIQSYSLKLFEKWQIGSRKFDNGILILIAPNEGEIWIEMGYGLEGQFPDSKTKKIIRDYMIPSFSDNEFSQGVLAGFNQILIEIEKEYDIILSKSQDLERPAEDDDRVIIPNIYKIIGVILLLFIDIKFFRGMLIYSLLRGLGRGGRSGGYGGSSRGGGGRSGGGGAGGSW